MRTSTIRVLALFLSLFVFHPSLLWGGDLLFQTPGALSGSGTRPTLSGGDRLLGHAGEIRVGANPVTITRIGFYGQVLKPATITWVIYPNIGNYLPLRRTEPVAFAPMASAQWLESPAFAPFTLAANTTYFIGFISDSEVGAVRFHFNDFRAGIPTTQNGLTSSTDPYELAANPYGTIASPLLMLNSTVQLGMRIGNPAVLLEPVPGAIHSNTVYASYFLPTAAAAGSLKLTFHDGAVARVLTLATAMESAGTRQFSFDPANPTGTPIVADGSAIPDGTYTVTLSYRKGTGELSEHTVANVTIDRVAPTLSFDAGEIIYTENNPPAPIATNPVVADANWGGGTLDAQIIANSISTDRLAISGATGLTVTGTSVLDGATVIGTASVSGGAVTGNTALKITLNANATDAHVQKLVGAIAFSSTSDNPIAGIRTARLMLTDAAGLQATGTRNILVVPVNDAPLVQPSPGFATFLEGDGVQANPVAVDAVVNVTDADSGTLAWATVTLATGFAPAEDRLIFTPGVAVVGNIVGSYDAATGVMTLTSPGATATVLQWRNALRSVRYSNVSDTPSAVDRVVSFVVNDGLASSAAATRILKVTPVNDRPVANDQIANVDEDTPRAIVLTADDPDSPLLTYTVIIYPAHGTLTGTAPNLIYTPSPDFHGSDSFAFHVYDGEKYSSPGTIAIAVGEVNDAPTLNPLPNIELPENWGATQVIPFSGVTSGAGNEVQILSVTAVSANPDIVPHPAVFYVSPDRAGTLTFKPAPGANGTTTISLIVNDGGERTATITRTFTVTVLPVNSPPTFTKGPDLSVGKNAGPQTVPAWATAIQAGPPDEAGQAVSFVTVAEQPALFAQQPRITPDGTLTFTPARGASGSATVTVFLRDNGGTANGGGDTSAVETFQIALTSLAEELGTYRGLVQAHPAASRAHERAGLVRVKVRATGNFTGNLRLGAKSYPLLGRFDQAGVAHFGRNTTLALPASSPALSLTLHLDVSNGTDKVTGTITSGGEPFAIVDADRILYSAAVAPAPPYRRVPGELLGRYTALLDLTASGRDPATVPQGSGFGTMNVSANGAVRFSGRLADGTRVSHAEFLSKTNTWPVHMLAYEGRGSITGRFTLASVPEVNITGAFDWFRPAIAASRLYPAGWPEGISGEAFGGKFVTPVPPNPPTAFPGLAPVSSSGNAELQFSAVDLPPQTWRLNIHPNNRVVSLPPGQTQLLLRINKYGVFSGSYIDPATKRKAPIHGAILQSEQRGAGFIVGSRDAGPVILAPASN